MIITNWIAIALMLALAGQGILVGVFAQQVKNRRTKLKIIQSQNNVVLPTAEVVLCLRGADPCLKETLYSLSRQKFKGQWRLKIIVDSLTDPSLPIVERVLLSLSKDSKFKPTWLEVNIEPLKKRPRRGSLKSYSLRQAFKGLNNDSKIVAIIDADAVVSPEWLSKLTISCSQPGVGAVSGNRWFIPENNSLMGLTRSVWNAGALVMMTILGIPWGGSLAVRREVIDAGGWTSILDHALCEDTCLISPLRRLKLKYFFIPDLLVIDANDNISPRSLVKWLTRQLLTARLHHQGWPLVAAHGIGTNLLLLLAMIKGAWLEVIIYELGCLMLLIWIEIIALQKKPRSISHWICALPPGQFVDSLATLMALLTETIEWSGVNYKVTNDPRGVEISKPSKSLD